MPHRSRYRMFLAALRSRLLYSCHEMTRLLSMSQDRTLPLPTRLKMQVHHVVCVWCRRYRDQLRLLRRSLRIQTDGREEKRGDSLTPESRARLKQSVRQGHDDLS